MRAAWFGAIAAALVVASVAAAGGFVSTSPGGAFSGTTATLFVTSDAGVGGNLGVIGSVAATSVASSGPIQGTTASFSGAIASTVGNGQDAMTFPIGARLKVNGGYYLYPAASGSWASTNGFQIDNGSLTLTGVGGFIDNYGTMAIRNSAANYPVKVDETDGFLITPKASIPTCGTVPEGTFTLVPGTGSVKTKYCLCTYDGSTYAWQSVISAAVGNTTTCPS